MFFVALVQALFIQISFVLNTVTNTGGLRRTNPGPSSQEEEKPVAL